MAFDRNEERSSLSADNSFSDPSSVSFLMSDQLKLLANGQTEVPRT